MEGLRQRLQRATAEVEAGRKALRARRAGKERQRQARKTKVAPAWDILRGKEFDVLREENREWLEKQIGRTLVVHFGTECKTFSRARELQRPGWRLPKPLRSAQHPLGLPGLTAKEKESLSRGNEMAEISVQLAFKLLAAGCYFIIENPERSRLWDLPEFVRLSKQAGVKEWICHNCMLGGRRRKATKFLSNLNLQEVEKRCTGKDGKCDRTGCPHEPWEPWWDEAAQKTVHPSAEETEYPEEMCEALAEGVCRAVDAQENSDGRPANYEWDFLEVFAGPNAPFSRAVEGRSVQTDKENPGTTSAQSVATPGCSGDVELAGEDPKKEETKEERRERENNECIGGLRSPWKSVQKLPKLREVGRQLRRILEDFLDAHPKFENMPQGGQQAEELEKAQEVEELRRIIAEVLGTEDARACDNGSPWRAGIVQAHINKTGDPESGLPRWLREGSPIGVARPVEPVGIFPRVDPEGKDRGTLEEILSEVAAKNNYKSFEEAKKYAEPEVQRIIAAGYVKDLGTWKDVVKAYGKVAVSKLACIVKVRKDGSVKARLVIDLRRSGVNRCVRLSERVVLPRIKEVLEDATYLLSQAGAGDEVEAMVADFKDAFHTLPVHPEEKKFGVARTFGDHFIGFETIMFGGEASPLVWGRAASYLNRSGQALFEPHEFLAECYVDDPVLLAAGNARRRRRSFAVFLLWMVVLGLPISWSKVSKGKRVEWCGSEIRLVNAFIVQAVLAESFVSDFAAEVEEALALPLIKRSTLRRIAGRAAWATGLVPTIRSFIDSLWAVSAELADDKQCTKKFKRGEPAVETARVAVALKWLRAFLGRMVGAGELGRTLDIRDRYVEANIRITCDASPWGLGAVLEVQGCITAYLYDEVSQFDAQTLGVQVGSCRSQAVLEALAIAVAVRTWLPTWATSRAGVVVRSDSTAALGALGKLASPNAAVNKIAREVSLDVAFSRYGIDVLEHLPGKLNTLADALSRAFEPGTSFEIPRELENVQHTKVDPRGQSWWQAEYWTVDGAG